MAADHLRICGFLHLGLWGCPAALCSPAGKCHHASCGTAPGGDRVPLPQGSKSGSSIQVPWTTFRPVSTATYTPAGILLMQVHAFGKS